jgi:hypothetical protein
MNRNLFTSALLEADNVRMELGLDMYQPINIFDTCIKMKIPVRFVDINMEGMYVCQEDGKSPVILISNQRPYPRRCFTCAHELGHHRFGHGTKLDVLSEQNNHSSSNHQDELLVDSFAGALLMPVAGIHAEFAKRSLKPNHASPLQFYIISSIFGTGYQSLITHCRANKIISPAKEKSLLKFSPAKILDHLVGPELPKTHFKVFDCHSIISALDLEVLNYLILPSEFVIEGDHLKKLKELKNSNVYIANKPGIVRSFAANSNRSFFIRIQKSGYMGLAEFRHLENKN